MLDWRIEHETLVVTTAEEVASDVLLRLYKLKKSTDLDELVEDLLQ